MDLVRRLWKQGITILLIEHNMRATMSLCQRITVLSFGRKIAEGRPFGDTVEPGSDPGLSGRRPCSSLAM